MLDNYHGDSGTNSESDDEHARGFARCIESAEEERANCYSFKSNGATFRDRRSDTTLYEQLQRERSLMQLLNYYVAPGEPTPCYRLWASVYLLGLTDAIRNCPRALKWMESEDFLHISNMLNMPHKKIRKAVLDNMQVITALESRHRKKIFIW